MAELARWIIYVLLAIGLVIAVTYVVRNSASHRQMALRHPPRKPPQSTDRPYKGKRIEP